MITERHRETEVIVITGLPEEMPEWMRTGPRADRILAKPFSISGLRNAVNEAIGAGGDASCASGIMP